MPSDKSDKTPLIFPSVIALALGILGFLGFFLTIPALIAGHVAFYLCSANPMRFKGKRMAAAGLAMGYLQIIIFALLLSFMLGQKDKVLGMLEEFALARGVSEMGLDISKISRVEGSDFLAIPLDNDNLTVFAGPVDEGERDDFVANISSLRDRLKYRMGKEPSPWVVFTGSEVLRFPELTWSVKVDDPSLRFPLQLAFVGTAPTHIIYEFISKSESLDAWTKLAAEYVYSEGNIEFDKFVDSYTAEVKQKGGDAAVLIRDEFSNLALLEFLLWADPGKVLEYNIVLLKVRDGTLVAQQYTCKSGKGGVGELMRTIPGLRAVLKDTVRSTGELFQIDKSVAAEKPKSELQ